MGIDGLSEATIEKFIGKGLIKEYADIFNIEQHRNEIINMEGFGEKSFKNLLASVNKARKTNSVRLLYGLGIPMWVYQTREIFAGISITIECH